MPSGRGPAASRRQESGHLNAAGAPDGAAAARSVADRYLELLASRGVEYFFGNAGTDFAPLIEAFAKASALGRRVPRPITAPHENVAVALAMGYTMVTGRPQVVMLHTNVGMANGLCQLLNSSRLNLPMLFTSGRTPVNEADLPGSRTIDIHWTQEMYDQAGMAREAVKWDYELRHPSQITTVVDRALAIARSVPPGPVYLMLPREVLAADLPPETGADEAPLTDVTDPYPDPAATERLAGWLAEAELPLVVTSTLGRDPAAVAALDAFAERFAVPVVQSRPRYMNLPTRHPMNLGYRPGEWLGRADLVLVMDCEVPWIPKRDALRPGARVVHVGADPLHQAIPFRGFRWDLALRAVPRAVLPAVAGVLGDRLPPADPAIERRRRLLADAQAARGAARERRLADARVRTPIDPAWLSHCLDEALGGRGVVIRESPLDLDHFARVEPSTLFGGASGLGWGLGGAIGARLAAPDRPVVATVGDGAYMYGNPVSAHYVSDAFSLPFLTVVFNNQSWHAVRQATRGMYPDGYAVKQNEEPLTDLQPSPAFEKVVLASGGYGERVEDPAAVPGALARALDVVASEGRQAVLNVICAAE